MIERPSNAKIEALAHRRPDLLDPLFAFFVMGWQSIALGSKATPHTGVDYSGKSRRIPPYTSFFGVDSVVRALFQAPEHRAFNGPSGLDTLAEMLL